MTRFHMPTPFKNSPRTATPAAWTRRHRSSRGLLATLIGATGVWLAGCGSAPAPTPTPMAPVPAPASATAATATSRTPPPPSVARTPKEYRPDAARHLYQLNAERIYKGRLPPMLYAIGTLEVQVDRQGNVTGLNWLRAPRHAPEVVAEIERTARAASPYPVPERLGRVTYTDTWLWHKSGRFQLDTLTEGQD